MNAEDKAKQILSDMKREAQEEAKLIADSPVVQTARKWAGLTRFWYQFIASLTVFFNRFIFPFYSWTAWFYNILFWKHFRAIWDKSVYTTLEDGSKKFSKVRGAKVIAATVVVLFVAYQSLFVLFDTVLYLTTARVNEVVYMSNAQEISAENNLHSAQGCIVKDTEAAFSCGVDDSLYFRIDSSGFNHIWSLFHNQTLFYPDYVAAPIAPGWEQCTITSYGIRVKTLMRTWDIYPTLLSATCGEPKK